tara:strand:- start:457 stop:699 length:243 start_codon:yes stop_codon:yes gene_type:complete
MESKEKEKKSDLYYLPVPLVKLVGENPELVLFLVTKLYQKIYPTVATEKIYDAVWTYIHNLEFKQHREIDTSSLKPEELN